MVPQQVRERASETMSGLIRCGLFSPSDGTLVSGVHVQRGVGSGGTGHGAKWGLQPLLHTLCAGPLQEAVSLQSEQEEAE